MFVVGRDFHNVMDTLSPKRREAGSVHIQDGEKDGSWNFASKHRVALHAGQRWAHICAVSGAQGLFLRARIPIAEG